MSKKINFYGKDTQKTNFRLSNMTCTNITNCPLIRVCKTNILNANVKSIKGKTNFTYSDKDGCENFKEK
jgi:hypothetical protein